MADAAAIAHGRLTANQAPAETVRLADLELRLGWARLDSEHGFTGFLKNEEDRYFSSAVRAAPCAYVESIARVSQLTAAAWCHFFGDVDTFSPRWNRKSHS